MVRYRIHTQGQPFYFKLTTLPLFCVRIFHKLNFAAENGTEPTINFQSALLWWHIMQIRRISSLASDTHTHNESLLRTVFHRDSLSTRQRE
jgi:hypothetical protein